MLTPEQQKWGDPAPGAGEAQLSHHKTASLHRRVRVCSIALWFTLALTLLPSLVVAYFSFSQDAALSFWDKAPAIIATLVGILAALALGALRRRAQTILLLQKDISNG